MKIHRTLLALGYCFTLAIIAYYAWLGLDYYLADLAERPRHDLYWSFKPGGTAGRNFGIAGAVMMTVMLLYSLRKRWRPLRRLGPIRMWLDYHILLGVCGPLFIILHSSFKARGLVALSFWSMVTVALSGALGRFIYRQLPRSGTGDELSFAEIEKLDLELSRQLTDLGLPESSVAEAETLAAEGIRTDRPLPLALMYSAISSFRLNRRLVRFRYRSSSLDAASLQRIRRAVKRKTLLRRRLLLWPQLRRAFHYWHVFHKPFALIMYLFMIVHIAVAWLTGYA